ncbi:MAG: hypothetical protein ACNI3A_15390 [Desulfovibrio sp.]|uniref:hypothetical protein n=1 Tax=Desulfovibrio sp. 7SRBS1 TaxID=3378064 RepID=UPI003B3C4D22
MFQSDSYHCYYMDHSFFDARQIGSIYSQLAGVCSENKDEDGLILSTCQRIEVYSASEGNPLSSLELPFQHDSGKDSVKKRLLSICCGIESQILGEKNIYYQVRNACSSSEEQVAI